MVIQLLELRVLFDEKCVLDCPDIQFETGQTHGIIGLNGAGKSTLFNVLSTFLKPAEGKVLLGDAKIKKEEILFLETNNFFYSNLTGKEYLNIFPTTNSNFNLDAINELLHVPLNQVTESYSAGMKKKLALMAIIKQDRPIYIFDEPFNGLDLESGKVLELIIQHLKAKGKTVFVSSHILAPLLTLCDEVHLLQNGRFTKKYNQQQFADIDNDLFTTFSKEADNIIGKLV
jgi:ABC-2 type transport system ATP-binding protein